MGKIENRKRSSGGSPTPGGSGVSATHELVINTVDDEIVGKQYKTFFGANDYALANPAENFITRFSGEITEDVQLVVNNTIVGLDNIKSYINGTVFMATFLGDFFGSIISNCRIKRFEGTPGGLSIPQNCFIEEVGNLEGGMGYIHLNTDIVDGDFTTIAPTPIGVVMFGGNYQSVNGNPYVKFNNDVTFSGMGSLGSSTIMDCKDVTGKLQFNDCRLSLGDLMYPDDNGAGVEARDSIISTNRLLTVDSITGDGNGLITVVTLYPHQMHDGEHIKSTGRDDSDFDINSAEITYIDDNTFTFGVLGTPSGATSNGYIQRRDRVTYIANPSTSWDILNSNMPGRFNFTGGRLDTLNVLSNNYISVTAPAIRVNDGVTIDIKNMASITSTRLQGVLEELYALIATPPTPSLDVIYWYTGNPGNHWSALDAIYDFASMTHPVKVIVTTPVGNNTVYFADGLTYGGLENVDIEFSNGPAVIYFQADTQVSSRFRNIKGDVLIANQNQNNSPIIGFGGKIRCNCEGDVKFQSSVKPFYDAASFAGTGSLELTGDWTSINGGVMNFNLSPYVADADNKFEIRRGYIEQDTFGGGNDGLSLLLQHAQTLRYQDEAHAITFKYTAVAGTYALVYDGNTFAEIPFDSDATILETALRTIPALSQVTVSGDYVNGFDIAMVGVNSSYRGTIFTTTQTGLIDGNGDNVSIGTQITKVGQFAQSVLLSTPLPGGGTYTLEYQSNISNAINFDANTGDTEAEIRSVTGYASLSCSGTLNSSGGVTIVWNELYGDPDTLLPASSLFANVSTLSFLPLTANAKILTQHTGYNGAVEIADGVWNENIRRKFTNAVLGVTDQKYEDDVVLLRDANASYALDDYADGHQITILCLAGPSFVTTTTNISGAGISTNNFKMYEGERIVLVKSGTEWRVVSFNSVMQEGPTTPYQVMPPRFFGEMYLVVDGSLFMGIDTSTDSGRLQINTSIPA